MCTHETTLQSADTSPRLEQQHGHLPKVKVDVVARLVRHVGAKVPPDEAVPHAIVLRERVQSVRRGSGTEAQGE